MITFGFLFHGPLSFLSRRNLSLDFSELERLSHKNLVSLPTNILVKMALSSIASPENVPESSGPIFLKWYEAHSKSTISQRLACHAIATLEDRGEEDLKKLFAAIDKELKIAKHGKNCFELDRIIFPIGYLSKQSLNLLIKSHPKIKLKIKTCTLRSDCRITNLTLALLNNAMESK
jgi:hypothetical protein